MLVFTQISHQSNRACSKIPSFNRMTSNQNLHKMWPPIYVHDFLIVYKVGSQSAIATIDYWQYRPIYHIIYIIIVYI